MRLKELLNFIVMAVFKTSQLLPFSVGISLLITIYILIEGKGDELYLAGVFGIITVLQTVKSIEYYNNNGGIKAFMNQFIPMMIVMLIALGIYSFIL